MSSELRELCSLNHTILFFCQYRWLAYTQDNEKMKQQQHFRFRWIRSHSIAACKRRCCCRWCRLWAFFFLIFFFTFFRLTTSNIAHCIAAIRSNETFLISARRIFTLKINLVKFYFSSKFIYFNCQLVFVLIVLEFHCIYRVRERETEREVEEFYQKKEIIWK